VKRTLRWVGIVLGVLILLAIALPFIINANMFRPTVEQRLSAALGRKVQIGNLSLSLFSGSLSADTLSIADDPNFSESPFLRAKAFKVGVEMLPLITSKTLNITGLSIERPEVNLIRNARGQWNFSSLATSNAPSVPPSSASPTPKQRPSTSAPAPQQSTSTPDFTVNQLTLRDGRITVGFVSGKKSVYQDLDLKASAVSLKSQFPVTMTAKLPGGGNLKLDGKVGPVDQTDASLTPLDAKLDLNELNLARTGFVDPSSGIAGIMDLTNALRSKNGMASSQGNIQLKQLQVVKGGSTSSVPVNVDYSADYDLRRSAGVLKQGVVKIGKAALHLAGTFATQGDSTVVHMTVNGQNLPVQDLQAVLPALGVILPKGSSLRTGTLNANLAAQGPVDRLVTTGTIGLFNAQLAGFDLGSKMAALSKFSGTQKSPDTSIQQLTSAIRVAPEGIQTSNMNLVLPAIGQLTGGGTISSNSALNMKMLGTLSGQSGLASTLGGLTGRKTSGSAKIPFTVQGTTSDPKFVPDVAGMMGGMVQSQAGGVLGKNPQTKGLTDALGGLFGKKKTSPPKK
jgi:AsmA protein